MRSPRGTKRQARAFDASDEVIFYKNALECAVQQKKELESTMRLFCPPGTYERYVAYCGKMRKLRKEEAEERERQIAKNIRYAVYGAAALLSLAGLYGLFLMTNFLKGLQ